MESMTIDTSVVTMGRGVCGQPNMVSSLSIDEPNKKQRNTQLANVQMLRPPSKLFNGCDVIPVLTNMIYAPLYKS